MAISGFDEESFGQIIRENLSSARPIANPEYLRGRAAKIKQISRAFNSPGRHVFIYGDRGVGKTSLAQSAAAIWQSSEAEPIYLACQNESTLFSLVTDAARLCISPLNLAKRKVVGESLRIGIPGLEYGKVQETDLAFTPKIRSLNEAVSVLRAVASQHSKEPVIIIDEFDQLAYNTAKKGLADLLKQISDQDIGMKFILCGIGQSLEELIGVYLSTERYITPVELDRLPHDARWEIITKAAEHFGLDVDREFLIRIGFISDGFPYYVHLLGEMLFWAVHDAEETIENVGNKHFEIGIKTAINVAQVSLRLAYDNATQK